MNFKKSSFLLVVIVSLCFGNFSFAQLQKTGTPQKLTFEEKVTVLFNRLTKDVVLEPGQAEKIRPHVEKIVRDREARIAELKGKKDDGRLMTKEQLQERREKRQAEEDAFKAEMKKILTEAQYQKFEAGLKRKRTPESENSLEIKN